MFASRKPRPGFALTVLSAILVCGGARDARAQSAQVQWRGVERVAVFADVHGAYSELVTLLRETGILDARDHWAAGRTHVVSPVSYTHLTLPTILLV